VGPVTRTSDEARAAAERLLALSGQELTRVQKVPHPAWIEPMLATLTDRRFSDPNWIFERKLDGERCLASRKGDVMKLFSRNQKRLENTYPEVADRLLAQVTDDFVIDGEMVAFDHGRTSFERLQQRSGISDPDRARASPVAVTYYIFDLMYLDGYDTRALPLRSRKALLRKAFRFELPLRFTTHRKGEGEEYFAFACAHGWEGLVAKRADSLYTSRRSPDWLKFKCQGGQEMVVGGFTDPGGSRIGFGALLLGYYEGDELRYAGKVGTGFDDRTLRELRRRMDGLEIKGSPFSGGRRFERGTHFVRPVLVAQVGFTEWTRDGMLRHPRFLGLREDKSAKEVTRERPSKVP
jgi:bifunctional non-homologous end joining protein LigD